MLGDGAPPTPLVADLAPLTADTTAPIIPAACTAYAISNGIFCGNPIAAVLAAPVAVATVASDAFKVVKVIVFLASASSSLANNICLAINAALPTADSAPAIAITLSNP